MGHDSGEFRFIVRREDQTAVDVEKAARKSERVDFVRIDDLDRKWNLRIGIADDVLGNTVDVLIDGGIVEQPLLLLDLPGKVPAQSDFPVERNEIDAALIDIARADVFDIGVLRLLLRLLLLWFRKTARSKHKNRQYHPENCHTICPRQ